MKKIIYLVMIITASVSCKAQNNTINIVDRCNQNLIKTNGSLYLKDIDDLYLPFIGTWKWIEGNKELTLTLIKQTKYHYAQRNDNFYKDRIVGYYIYKENGVILANTTNDNLNDDYALKINLDLNCYSKLVTTSFEDVLKNKDYHGWFEKVSTTQIKFHGKEQERLIRVKQGQPMPANMPLPGNTFPLEMILIKQ